MLGKLIKKIGRTARGATPRRYRLVFYDLRISNIETKWKYIRIGWIFSEYKATWSDVLAVSDTGKARQISDQEIFCTLYGHGTALEKKACHVFVQASSNGRDFFRIASVEVDIASMAQEGDKHILQLDVPGDVYGRTDVPYQVQMSVEVYREGSDGVLPAGPPIDASALRTADASRDKSMPGPEGGSSTDLRDLVKSDQWVPAAAPKGSGPRVTNPQKLVDPQRPSTPDMSDAASNDGQKATIPTSPASAASTPMTTEDLDDYQSPSPSPTKQNIHDLYQVGNVQPAAGGPLDSHVNGLGPAVSKSFGSQQGSLANEPAELHVGETAPQASGATSTGGEAAAQSGADAREVFAAAVAPETVPANGHGDKLTKRAAPTQPASKPVAAHRQVRSASVSSGARSNSIDSARPPAKLSARDINPAANGAFSWNVRVVTRAGASSPTAAAPVPVAVHKPRARSSAPAVRAAGPAAPSRPATAQARPPSRAAAPPLAGQSKPRPRSGSTAPAARAANPRPNSAPPAAQPLATRRSKSAAPVTRAPPQITSHVISLGDGKSAQNFVAKPVARASATSPQSNFFARMMRPKALQIPDAVNPEPGPRLAGVRGSTPLSRPGGPNSLGPRARAASTTRAARGASVEPPQAVRAGSWARAPTKAGVAPAPGSKAWIYSPGIARAAAALESTAISPLNATRKPLLDTGLSPMVKAKLSATTTRTRTTSAPPKMRSTAPNPGGWAPPPRKQDKPKEPASRPPPVQVPLTLRSRSAAPPARATTAVATSAPRRPDAPPPPRRLSAENATTRIRLPPAYSEATNSSRVRTALRRTSSQQSPTASAHGGSAHSTTQRQPWDDGSRGGKSAGASSQPPSPAAPRRLRSQSATASRPVEKRAATDVPTPMPGRGRQLEGSGKLQTKPGVAGADAAASGEQRPARPTRRSRSSTRKMLVGASGGASLASHPICGDVTPELMPSPRPDDLISAAADTADQQTDEQTPEPPGPDAPQTGADAMAPDAGSMLEAGAAAAENARLVESAWQAFNGTLTGTLSAPLTADTTGAGASSSHDTAASGESAFLDSSRDNSQRMSTDDPAPRSGAEAPHVDQTTGLPPVQVGGVTSSAPTDPLIWADNAIFKGAGLQQKADDEPTPVWVGKPAAMFDAASEQGDTTSSLPSFPSASHGLVEGGKLHAPGASPKAGVDGAVPAAATPEHAAAAQSVDSALDDACMSTAASLRTAVNGDTAALSTLGASMPIGSVTVTGDLMNIIDKSVDYWADTTKTNAGDTSKLPPDGHDPVSGRVDMSWPERESDLSEGVLEDAA